MKTNLLAQNDNLVIENLKADVGKSVFDLSHSVTFPVDVQGAIYPICCIETVPSDSFEINVECLLRQLTPLKVPLMTNFRLNTAFYYCDNRLAWKKWDRFMTGGRSGNEVYDIPRVANLVYSETNKPRKFDLVDFSLHSTSPNKTFQNIDFSTSLHSYFGVSLNHSESDTRLSYDDATDYSSELPVAFPFFDYQIICRDYYTNVDRLKSQVSEVWAERSDFNSLTGDWAYANLFPSDDDEIRLVDGVQTYSGFQSGDDTDTGFKGFYLDKIRYHDVRPDYFTSSKKAPMRGTPPSMGASTTLKLPAGTEILLNSEDNIIGRFTDSAHFYPNLDFEIGVRSSLSDINSVLKTDNTNVPKLTPNPEIPEYNVYAFSKSSSDTPLINGLKGYTYTDLELTGTLSTDWTVADIRLLSQLTVWQELNMLHEPYYNDFLNAHFDNVRVGESPVEKPQYIGGTSQLISINEILQTSQSTESSPLGNQGATAMSLAQNFVGRYFCNNYGYIIGVAYIVPELLYKPAMPRHFSRRTKEEYYSPEFANLSMQATLNKEIFFSNDDDWNNSPWGYVGSFDELRSIPNRIAGDLLNPDYTDLQKWVLTREFDNDNLPGMNSNWLSLKGNVDTAAFAVENMPKFMLQCANYIKAVRPLPKVAIPKAL